jgi:hypothetical protein
MRQNHGSQHDGQEVAAGHGQHAGRQQGMPSSFWYRIPEDAPDGHAKKTKRTLLPPG